MQGDHRPWIIVAIQSTTDFASYFPLFHQSQPLGPFISVNTILISENSAHYPLANLAKPWQSPQFSQIRPYILRNSNGPKW